MTRNLAEMNDVATLAALLESETEEILRTANRDDSSVVFDPKQSISRARMFEVADATLRTLRQVEVNQDGEVRPAQYVAHIWHWFSQLKPVREVNLQLPDEKPELAEIVDINERMAAILADRVFVRMLWGNSELTPDTWRVCRTGCVGGSCYFRNGPRILRFQRRHLFSGVSALRYRAGDPEWLTVFIEMRILLSCSDYPEANDPAIQSIRLPP